MSAAAASFRTRLLTLPREAAGRANAEGVGVGGYF